MSLLPGQPWIESCIRCKQPPHTSPPPSTHPPPHTTPPPSTHVDTPSDENASLESELQKMRQMIMEKDKEIEEIKQSHKRKLSEIEHENHVLKCINKKLRDSVKEMWLWICILCRDTMCPMCMCMYFSPTRWISIHTITRVRIYV